MQSNISLDNSSNKNIVNKFIIDIKNIKKLDKEMLHTISLLPNEDKMLIIYAYNDMMEYLANYIDNMK